MLSNFNLHSVPTLTTYFGSNCSESLASINRENLGGNSQRKIWRCAFLLSIFRWVFHPSTERGELRSEMRIKRKRTKNNKEHIKWRHLTAFYSLDCSYRSPLIYGAVNDVITVNKPLPALSASHDPKVLILIATEQLRCILKHFLMYSNGFKRAHAVNCDVRKRLIVVRPELLFLFF